VKKDWLNALRCAKLQLSKYMSVAQGSELRKLGWELLGRGESGGRGGSRGRKGRLAPQYTKFLIGRWAGAVV